MALQRISQTCALVTDQRDAAECRFVNARAENDELEQELADLRVELQMTKDRSAAQRADPDGEELFRRGVWTGWITAAVLLVVLGLVASLFKWLYL